MKGIASAVTTLLLCIGVQTASFAEGLDLLQGAKSFFVGTWGDVDGVCGLGDDRIRPIVSYPLVAAGRRSAEFGDQDILILVMIAGGQSSTGARPMDFCSAAVSVNAYFDASATAPWGARAQTRIEVTHMVSHVSGSMSDREFERNLISALDEFSKRLAVEWAARDR